MWKGQIEILILLFSGYLWDIQQKCQENIKNEKYITMIKVYWVFLSIFMFFNDTSP